MSLPDLKVPALALMLSLGGSGGPAPVVEARTAAELPHSAEFHLGVQTHFGQNWPAARLKLALELPVRHLRDGLSWEAAERQRGHIAFPDDRLRALRSACAAGMRLTLTVIPRNPLYEQNNVVATAGGRAAFLAYLNALLDALPGCVHALEIGNEINGARALPVRAGADGPDAYVQLMAAIYEPLKRKASDVSILGGSTNAIGTGFLNELFSLGLLEHVDGIAVHPYRDHGENLDWELRRLAEVMAGHGKVVPVWATEFSDNFDIAELGAPALLKMTVLLGASGVEQAYWYALSDQQWFRHMGLFDAQGREKPAARAFAFLQRELLPRGRPSPASDSRLLQLYGFGESRWVAWGAPREVEVPEGGAAFTATGERIQGPVNVGTEPVVISGLRPSFGKTAVLADSLLQFGSAPWSYHVRPYGAAEKRLAPLDSQFATSMGDRYTRPLFASDLGGAVAGTRERPLALVLRFTALKAMRAKLQACVETNPEGEGLFLAVERNGGEFAGQQVHGTDRLTTEALELEPGDRLDLVLSPAGSSRVGNTFRYRLRLLDPELQELPCPADAGGWSDA